ncbi:MAG: methyl-accepting chemotaxis protein [Sideroxyarcus sp.]|nr:methyl-accepting chemotaxis protein [Sideroxyarcus sp.]
MLIAVFAVSILAIILLSWLGMSKLHDLEKEANVRAKASQEAADASHVGAVLYQIVADSVINNNPAESAKDWQEGKLYAEKELKIVEDAVDSDAERANVREAHQAFNDFVTIYEKEMLPLIRVADRNAAAITAVDDKIDTKIQLMADSMNKICESMDKETVAASEKFESVFDSTVATLLITGAVIMAVAIFIGMGITRNVLRQLGGEPKDVADVVNTMAAGDFSQQPRNVPVQGSLLAHAYQMQASLGKMVTQIKTQAKQLEDMAHSLAVAAKQITDNVNHESDAVSSMAAAIEEVSVSTSHISDQGSNARQIADSSRNNAEQGTQVVDKTVAGLLTTAQEIQAASAQVSRLGEDATRIVNVVQVIKEIADQTNLLALNAAIEAARAGEQGRGFAVVADEVRKLAERTGNATNEINQMSGKINEMVSHALESMAKVVETTRQGVADAETVQSSIAAIRHSFGEVTGVIDDISAALVEQNVASSDLAKNTESVAQMSEENSGAAQSLLSLANDLEAKAVEVRDAVAIFKV